MGNEQNDLRVDYVELAADDLGEMKRFYGSVFGWKLTDYGDEYTSFDDGRLSGGFRREAGGGGPGGSLVVMYAEDLEAVEAKVRDSGGRIVAEIFSFPGGRRFHFADPSGNELAVWSDR